VIGEGLFEYSIISVGSIVVEKFLNTLSILRLAVSNGKIRHILNILPESNIIYYFYLQLDPVCLYH
jgi:hypothetical protein